jgi:carbon monoxide dehydrogenase subunit G
MKYFLKVILTSSILFITAALAEPVQNEDIDVKVTITGENVIVDLSMVVEATPQQVWAVLTDFEHMANYISNLKESRVISTSGFTQTIFQRGEASFGLMSFPFESTREMQLTPLNKIGSHMVSGSMRKMEGETQLIEENGRIKIVLHSETIPGNWIPPLVGKQFIEHETREQFQEIRNEILKRKSLPSSVNTEQPARSNSSP